MTVFPLYVWPPMETVVRVLLTREAVLGVLLHVLMNKEEGVDKVEGFLSLFSEEVILVESFILNYLSHEKVQILEFCISTYVLI